MPEQITNFPLIFGILASLLHVLSGPDHLAAIGPLAVNSKRRTWLIGVSWGIGHLSGMMLIGLVFFYLKEFIPADFISENSERLVGIMLIIIGIWAIYKMLTYHHVDEHVHDHAHTDSQDHAWVHRHHHHHETSGNHNHTHTESIKQGNLAAFGIGVLHGLAGVSHFIGMLPTLAFESRVDSAMYLTGFGFGTILAMVMFSTIIGLVARKASQSRKDTLFRSINGIAGITAIFVGIFWLWSAW